MKHALSWFLSILFHTVLMVVLLHTVDLAPMDLEEIMKVELTQEQTPEPIAQLPVVEKRPESQPEPPDEPEAPMVQAPLPMDKTVVLADPPPTPEPVVEPEAAPEPEPDVVEISPVKTLPTEEPVKDDAPKTIQVRKDFTVSRGHEARFGRALMGDYFSYSTREFSGQFKTHDDRVISIIDARNTKYGRFLIYDSKNKTLRRLKQAFGKYVYTIGPSLFADEPVVGSVTFMAKDDHIERFILTTNDDRIAHYPRKVHVREEEVTFAGKTSEISGNLSLPPYGDGHPGVVIIHGPECIDPALIQGFTRALSMNNLGAMTFIPRGCMEDEPNPAGMAELTTDTVAAVAYLRTHARMQNGAVGLWGNGAGVAPAIAAANQAHPPFLVCLLSDNTPMKSVPKRTTLAQLDMPVLWLITGRETAKWHSLVRTLESLRDRSKKPFSIVIAPLKASQEVLNAESTLSAWVEQVAEDHARLAVSWIQNHVK
ncbi:hypothetical protein [Pseudodesulfovibrio sediminis]|uniref:Dienelactone hydrolase domain-containing protein n=1 Tax=Pseudodesulfovibrio sediminis TaxID=2810563 RepID=A0ABN6EUH5_9BACT|nr:hypothetical protein [Pseudodesulfovibrio sediminis]BCS88909.1 hypothetical protein PSDVSF_21510 [Pseudodesulfovibrio sediminis]